MTSQLIDTWSPTVANCIRRVGALAQQILYIKFIAYTIFVSIGLDISLDIPILIKVLKVPIGVDFGDFQ